MTAEWLVSVAMLAGLAIFLALVVWMSLATAIDLLSGKRGEDLRDEGWGRDHDKDWP